MPVNRRWIFLIYIVVICVLLVSITRPYQQSGTPVSMMALTALKWPLVTVTYLVQGITALINSPTLIDENKRLRNTLQERTIELSQHQEALEENKRLRALLTLQAQYPFKTLAARVIGGSADFVAKTLIIDRGAHAGLRLNDPVLSNGALVGRVSEVGPVVSKVALITNPEVKISARVKRSRDTGLIVGSLDGTCFLRYLPLDADIQEGDTIITAGADSLFPKGLHIGSVHSVEAEPSIPFLYARLDIASQPSRIEEVLCIVSDD